MKKILLGICCISMLVSCSEKTRHGIVALQTDFGLKDGAVAAMRGVAYGVDENLVVADLTHEIPVFNTWEAAYRLRQVIEYWPANTVFVSVVDPGVGTERRSLVVKTKKDHYIVTPDNGTLTLVAESEGIAAARLIDETINRRQGSSASYTFHGRDVYVYTAARLAAGRISFEEVGPEYKDALTAIPYQRAIFENGLIKGNIPVLDIQYGNVWTNIPDSILKTAGIKTGDSLAVSVSYKDSAIYSGKVLFANTFGEVPEGQPLGYLNSLLNFSVAINMGSFAATYKVSSGADWNLSIKK